MLRIRLAASAFLLGLAATGAASAMPADPASRETAFSVRHGDLDLASDTGVAALDRRLASAIRSHCRQVAPYLPHQARARRACHDLARQDIDPQRSAAIRADRLRATQLSARDR